MTDSICIHLHIFFYAPATADQDPEAAQAVGSIFIISTQLIFAGAGRFLAGRGAAHITPAIGSKRPSGRQRPAAARQTAAPAVAARLAPRGGVAPRRARARAAVYIFEHAIYCCC